MAVLKIERLFCGYGGKAVVRDVSLEAERGETIAIAGPNGCGKTTLLRALCGYIPVASGEIFVDGVPLTDISQRERATRIAMLSQTGAGGDYFDYTVRDTVLMGRYARHRGGFFSDKPRDDASIAEKYIGEVGLKGYENRLITELSGGQLQRALLARAFAQEPDVLLLDEPANHLDFKSQTELAELLKRFTDSGKTVVGVFHDINFAASVSDRIMLMQDGEKIMCDTVPEVLRSEKLTEVFGADVREYMKKIAALWI